jgi:drug/metabolite transporter (DMT)-like permease
VEVYLGVLLALITALLWGSRDVVLKKAFAVRGPFEGVLNTLLMTFVSSAAALPFFGEMRYWTSVDFTAIVQFVLAGALQFVVAMFLYYRGIQSAGASVASVVSQTSAIATPLMAMALLGEPSSPQLIAGVLFGGSGIFVVSASHAQGGHLRWTREAVYPALAGVIWAITPLILRHAFVYAQLPLTAAALSSGVCLAAVGASSLIRQKRGALFELRGSAALTSGAVMSGIGQVTVFAALALAAAVYVVPTYSLKTVVTVTLGHFLLPKSENVGSRIVVGAAMAVVGVLLVNL